MKVILIAFFSLPWFALSAQEVEYHGRINISEYSATTVRKSWCIFSDGNSGVENSEILSRAAGPANTHYDQFNFRGVNYLKRKVEWTNQAGKNSMNLRFYAESAQFSGQQDYDKGTCTYKTWMGQSTSAETSLRAKAAFILPKNVWAIKISSVNSNPQGQLAIDLSNDDYSADGKLKKKPFYQFNNSRKDMYFQVNPSYDGGENFVYLDLLYVSRTLQEQNMVFDFNVEFIATEQCLSELKGVQFTDLLRRQVKENKIENTLVNLACMMNTEYVKHTLGQLHLNGLAQFFKKIDELEKESLAQFNAQSSAQDRHNLSLIMKLSERMRYYYSYEILKETMAMLQEQIEHNGKSVDAWMYLEILRRRGVLYLAEVLEHLNQSTKENLKTAHGPFVVLAPAEKLKYEIFFQKILPLEFSALKRSNELIFRPRFLSSEAFAHLQSTIESLNLNSQDFINITSREISATMTVGQLQKMQSQISQLIVDLRYYNQEIQKFKITQGNDSPSNWVEARRSLLTQIESIYTMNLETLASEVGIYFRKHFEDPIFKNIRVGKKRYDNALDFMKDFERLMQEVRL